MPKRKTKKQREQEAYDALFQRVSDICNGACGYVPDWEQEWMGPAALSNAVPVLKATFLMEKKNADGKIVTSNDYLFSMNNLDKYDNPTSITEFYFEHKVRA